VHLVVCDINNELRYLYVYGKMECFCSRRDFFMSAICSSTLKTKTFSLHIVHLLGMCIT